MTIELESKHPSHVLRDTNSAQLEVLKDELSFKSKEAVVDLLLRERAKYMEIIRKSEEGINLDFEKDLSKEQLESVQKICEKNKTSYKDFAIKAMTSVIKKYNTVSQNAPDFESKSLAELEEVLNGSKGRTYKGLAEARIGKVVELVIDYNNNQPEKATKWFLSPTMIGKLTGSNRPALLSFFASHKVMIDDHNIKHDLKDMDNRKGIGGMSIEKLKQQLDIPDVAS